MTKKSRPIPEASPEGAAKALRRVLQCAENFMRRHAKDPAIDSTYGYFTRHSLARLNQERLKAILDVAGRRSGELRRPLRILDLACGGGLTTCALATLGHRTLGIDIDGEEIRMARLFAQEEKLDGMFLQGDLVNDLSWERTAEETLGGKPDIITLAYALHQLSEVSPLLKRLNRWMEPGSQLLINEENPASFLFTWTHRMRFLLRKTNHAEWHRPLEEWKRLLESHDFKVLPQVIGMNPLPALSRVKPDKSWSIVFVAQRR